MTAKCLSWPKTTDGATSAIQSLDFFGGLPRQLSHCRMRPKRQASNFTVKFDRSNTAAGLSLEFPMRKGKGNEPAAI